MSYFCNLRKSSLSKSGKLKPKKNSRNLSAIKLKIREQTLIDFHKKKTNHPASNLMGGGRKENTSCFWKDLSRLVRIGKKSKLILAPALARKYGAMLKSFIKDLIKQVCSQKCQILSIGQIAQPHCKLLQIGKVFLQPLKTFTEKLQPTLQHLN